MSQLLHRVKFPMLHNVNADDARVSLTGHMYYVSVLHADYGVNTNLLVSLRMYFVVVLDVIHLELFYYNGASLILYPCKQVALQSVGGVLCIGYIFLFTACPC